MIPQSAPNGIWKQVRMGVNVPCIGQNWSICNRGDWGSLEEEDRIRLDLIGHPPGYRKVSNEGVCPDFFLFRRIAMGYLVRA